MMKFCRSKGYSKHQSDYTFSALILIWKFPLHAMFRHSKIARLVEFLACATLTEFSVLLVDITNCHAQPFASIKNPWSCTKQ